MKTSDVLKILSTIVKTYPMNKRLSLDSCEMTRTLRSILSTTDRYSRHIKTDKFVIKLASAGGHTYKCLHLVSENSGSLIPLSKSALVNCLSGQKVQTTITRASVIAALREAVRYQIDEFRSKQKMLREELIQLGYRELARELIICPLTNKSLSSGTVHVDHKIEFIVLLDAWLKLKTNCENFIDVPARLHRGRVVIDEAYEKSWQNFHCQHAMLQLTLGKANIKKGSSGYRSNN